MAQQTINVGTAPNDGTGTPLRTAFQYTNSNFSELYTAVGPSGNNIVVPGSATITGDLTVKTNVLKVNSSANRVGVVTTNLFKPLTVEAGSTAADTINQGLVINSSASFGVGVGASYSALVFSRNRSIDTASLEDVAQIFGGNSSETTSAGGVLGFSTKSSSNVLTERYRIDNAGIHTWSNVGGVAGTAMTLNSTGLGVGKAPLARLDVASTRAASVIGGIVGTTGTGVVNDECQFLIKNVNTASGQNNGAGIGGLLEASASNKSSLLFYVDSGTAVTNVGRFDSNGNLGIGVTPSATMKLDVQGQSIRLNSGSATGFSLLRLGGTASDSFFGFAGLANDIVTGTSAGDTVIGSNKAGANLRFISGNGVLNATLDASGNLLVGTTDTSSTSGAGFKIIGSGLGPYVVNAASTNAALAYTMYSTGAAAYRFYVGWGGTVFATNTTISAISDARLKENVQDIDVGLGAILALKPRKFDWKAGKGKDIKGDRGFIAQEFEQVFPQLVDEWKDAAPEGEAPYKSVRQDLIPVLVKAIQELTARVQTLETR